MILTVNPVYEISEEAVLSLIPEMEPGGFIMMPLYPNPTKDVFYIPNYLKFTDQADLYIFTVNGEIVYISDFNNEYEINVVGLIPGVYIVKIFSGRYYNIGKFIKK